MKDVKTKSSTKTPRILTDTARAPKELARKSIIESKEKAKEVAERQQPNGEAADESPEQYAENRIEQTAEETVHRTGDEGFLSGQANHSKGK